MHPWMRGRNSAAIPPLIQIGQPQPQHMVRVTRDFRLLQPYLRQSEQSLRTKKPTVSSYGQKHVPLPSTPSEHVPLPEHTQPPPGQALRQSAPQ